MKKVASCARSSAPLKWYSPNDPPFQLLGFAWFDKEHIYRRLPGKIPPSVGERVDFLANHTAGGQIRFQTNSTRISIRVRLDGSFSHLGGYMTPSGQCGFDLYVGPPKQQVHNWSVSPIKPVLMADRPEVLAMEYEGVFANFSEEEYRCCCKGITEMLNATSNFPLYRGVKEVSIGLDPQARVAPPPPFDQEGKIIVYGTSITQGGYASHPGMAHTNILSRRLNLEFVNLGFGSSGDGDPGMAQLMTEIAHPLCFILDYDANAPLERLKQTLPGFIRILREKHPATPILVVSNIPASINMLFPTRSQKEQRAFDKETVASFRKKGDRHIYYCDGTTLLGKDFGDCFTDGGHPNDMGFLRMAEALTPALKRIIERG